MVCALKSLFSAETAGQPAKYTRVKYKGDIV
jgi:hypothetical protein